MAKKTNLKASLVMSLFLLAIVSTAGAEIIYVDADASPGGDGTIWGTAYKYLQDALDDAVADDEVWVAEGTYKPDANTANPGSGDREATFQLINGVAIYGGFPAGGGTWAECNPSDPNNETILSGDLNGNDGPNFANNGENSYHVVTGSGTDETAVLDGFTITAGNADSFPSHRRGGGMYNDFGSPMVMNCTLRENAASGIEPPTSNCCYTHSFPGCDDFDCEERVCRDDPRCCFIMSRWALHCVEVASRICSICRDEICGDGAGMYNKDSSPMLVDCTFTSNSAGREGGGIYNCSNSNPILDNCTFSGNLAARGGGMTNQFCSPTLIDCTFSGNSASRDGGGMYNYESSPTVTNCTFTGNSAEFSGGGMYNRYSGPMLTNCTFSGNSASSDGGGMYNLESSPTVTNCTFSGNSASSDGGGLYNYDSNLIIDNCTFTGNSAFRGGGVHNWGEEGPHPPHPLRNPVLTNCTFSGNSAYDGGGMHNTHTGERSPLPYQHLVLINCTFSGNSATFGGGGMLNEGEELHRLMHQPVLTNCTFSSNSAGVNGGGMYNRCSSPRLDNCTFSGNSAKEGGGMCNRYSGPRLDNCTFSGNSASRDGGGMQNWDSSPMVTNCILWGNAASSGGNEIALERSSTIDVDYCDVRGGQAGIYDDGSGNTINWGAGNIDADPCFVDPGYWDANGTPLDPNDDFWIDGDYHLQTGSPCIDAGDNTAVPVGVTTDPDGHPRIIDGDCNDTEIVDMGAYEFNYAYIGDFDYDCDVDFADFAVLALAWLTEDGEAGWNPDCDISIPADNKIDWADVEVLSDNWLAGLDN